MEAAERYNRWLFDRCEPYLGRRVLDAGAGIGTFSELASPGREVVALEPDPELAAVLKRRFAGRTDVTVAEGAAEDVEGRFDSVVCLNVLEHIPDDVGALKRFHEVLVPGGRLLLLVPAHPSLFGSIDRAVAHERRYDKGGLRSQLVRTGFAVETLRLVNPLGALGWLWSSRIRQTEQVPEGPLLLYDRLVPVLRLLDRVEWPLGLSVWAVGAAEDAQEECAEDPLDGESHEGQPE